MQKEVQSNVGNKGLIVAVTAIIALAIFASNLDYLTGQAFKNKRASFIYRESGGGSGGEEVKVEPQNAKTL